MKYCVKCGNPMDDAMQFCQKCGAKCVIPIDEANYLPQQDNYAEYWGLHYKDPESRNEIELTPNGVHIFHNKGMKQFRFDKTIPYSEIIKVNSERASIMKSGYLSIITATEGITGKASHQQLLFDHNTVLFTKKTEPEAERIYRAIEDICSAPPASTIHTTYYESSTGKQEVVSSPSLKNPVKPRKKTEYLITILAVFIMVTIVAISGNGNHSEEPEASTSVIIDVEKYGNISGNELIALLGEPDEISQSTCQGAFDIPCVYYEYGNDSILGEVSFVLVNDQVVRFTSYSDYPYESKDEVLTQFGINEESSCTVAADTDIALRYRCPSAKVDDFWINLIDGDTFGFLQVTYDMEYFEEWYLPLTSDEEINYKTDAELTMKSLLTSPKTADFPWYDWEYGKNLFYISVSSYVDSENAFGAKTRTTFTFVYSRLTDEIVLAIVNDEVVVNNGYVAVDELIQHLYDATQKATA